MSTDSLSQAIARYRERGYTHDLVATDDGHVVCDECGTSLDPATMQIDHTLRFEGPSDPGDLSILLAVSCDCGVHGLYSAAYGPAAPAADAAVLRRFSAGRRAADD